MTRFDESPGASSRAAAARLVDAAGDTRRRRQRFSATFCRSEALKIAHSKLSGAALWRATNRRFLP